MSKRAQELTSPATRLRRRVWAAISWPFLRLSENQRFWIGFALLCLITALLIHNPIGSGTGEFVYKEGDIAREAIFAPADIYFVNEEEAERNREMARESWQVTQVNELLQHIERYEGIVVVCTNHFKGLDGASLRRFTFKVEFRELGAEQRWQMFQAESGIKARSGVVPKETHDIWRAKLARMEQLTAGDFATVKRQSEMLGLSLSPEEWLEQLQLECEIKRKDNARIGFV